MLSEFLLTCVWQHPSLHGGGPLCLRAGSRAVCRAFKQGCIYLSVLTLLCCQHFPSHSQWGKSIPSSRWVPRYMGLPRVWNPPNQQPWLFFGGAGRRKKGYVMYSCVGVAQRTCTTPRGGSWLGEAKTWHRMESGNLWCRAEGNVCTGGMAKCRPRWRRDGGGNGLRVRCA